MRHALAAKTRWTTTPVVANAWIRIEGRRIDAVGRGSPPRDDDAHVLDLRGRTVIPGLSDMHFHLAYSREELPWQFKLALAYGVTVLRDVGSGTLNRPGIAGDSIT